jgi:hypothetical protein
MKGGYLNPKPPRDPVWAGVGVPVTLRDLWLASRAAGIGSVGDLLVNHRYGRDQVDPVVSDPDAFMQAIQLDDYNLNSLRTGGKNDHAL